MNDSRRRNVMKAMVLGVALMAGTSHAFAQDGKPAGGDKLKVTLSNRVEIVCKNILGNRACLNFLEENDKFYLELTYRSRSARVEIADSEQEIANWYGIKFKIKISDIRRDGNIFEFRVRLIADPPIGPNITLIDETVRVDVGSLKSDTPDDKKPVLMFGAAK